MVALVTFCGSWLMWGVFGWDVARDVAGTPLLFLVSRSAARRQTGVSALAARTLPFHPYLSSPA